MGQLEDGWGDVDVGRQLAGLAARFDAGATHQEGQVRGRLVGEELAAGEAVLAEEEAVVGGEDDPGVAQAVHGAERVDDLLDAVVDRAQRLQGLLVVDAVGVDVFGREEGGFADEAGLVVDVALVEAFGGTVGELGTGQGVVVSRRRLGAGRPAEVPVRGGVVELQVEGLFLRGARDLFVGYSGEASVS